jgi:hypothetical protein
MKFDWDEEKNRSNIEKHGIDFREAQDVFLSPRLSVEDTRQDYGEKRIITIGSVGTSVCVVVFTRREETTRIISARKANERERKRYYERIEKPET